MCSVKYSSITPLHYTHNALRFIGLLFFLTIFKNLLINFHFASHLKLAAIKEPSSDVGLKRNIGLLAAVNIIIGVMIGSGIFISPIAALAYSGSIGLCLIIWALCGIVSLLGSCVNLLFSFSVKS